MISIYSKVQRWDDKVPIMLESVIEQSYKKWKLYILASEMSKEKIETYLKERNYEGGNIFCEVNEDLLKESVPPFLKYSSQSEFLFHIDGDDYLEFDCLERLLEGIDATQSDLAVCGVAMHNLSKGNILNGRQLPKDFILTKSEYSAQFQSIFQFFRTTWGILYRSSLFEKNSLSELPLKESCGSYGLDTMIALALLGQTKKIVILSGVGYHYMIWGGSISNKFHKNREMAAPILYWQMEQFLLSHAPEINRENQIFIAEVYTYGICDVTRALFQSDLALDEKINKYHCIIANEVSRKAFLSAKDESLGLLQKSYFENLKVFFHLKKRRKIVGTDLEYKCYEMFLALWNLTEESVSFKTYFEALKKKALLSLVEKLGNRV